MNVRRPKENDDDDLATMESCSICLEHFTEEDAKPSPVSDDDDNKEEQEKSLPTRRLHRNPCGHSVHAHCLRTSIRSGHYDCPVCRAPLDGSSMVGDGGGGRGDENGPERRRPEETSSDDHKLLKRYTRMLQLGKLPPTAVRQRMVVDGMSPSAIDAFFTGGLSRELSAQGDDDETDDNDPRDRTLTEKYRKMLDVGMPEGAVRQKMELAGCTSEDIDGFFREFAN